MVNSDLKNHHHYWTSIAVPASLALVLGGAPASSTIGTIDEKIVPTFTHEQLLSREPQERTITSFIPLPSLQMSMDEFYKYMQDQGWERVTNYDPYFDREVSARGLIRYWPRRVAKPVPQILSEFGYPSASSEYELGVANLAFDTNGNKLERIVDSGRFGEGIKDRIKELRRVVSIWKRPKRNQ